MSLLFFFNDPAPTEIYTLSLHDALPISHLAQAGGDHQLAAQRAPALLARQRSERLVGALQNALGADIDPAAGGRSEEHTSELQSRRDLVCRLLLEKKKKQKHKSNKTQKQ